MRLCPNSFTQCIFVSARAHAVVSAPFSPDGPTEVFRGTQSLVTGDRPGGRWLPWLGVLAGRDDGVCAAVCNGVMALARVVGSVRGNRSDLYIRRNLVQQLGQHRRVADLALVISMARISSVCSSTPRWILRHRRCFEPPCLRPCHSPSPSALMPVLSIRRFSGPCEPW